jgi:hypothetical protein
LSELSWWANCSREEFTKRVAEIEKQPIKKTSKPVSKLAYQERVKQEADEKREQKARGEFRRLPLPEEDWR